MNSTFKYVKGKRMEQYYFPGTRVSNQYLPSQRRTAKHKKTASGKYNREHYSRMQRRAFRKSK